MWKYLFKSGQQKPRATGLTLRQLLKGNRVGNIQSFGNFQMLPLLSELEERTIKVPNSIYHEVFEAETINILPVCLQQTTGASETSKLEVNPEGKLEYQFTGTHPLLETLMAAFQIEKQQVGAIFLVSNRVIGIERMPSHAFWKEIWRAVLVKYYAPQALAYQDKYGIETEVFKALQNEIAEMRDLSTLAEAMQFAKEKEALQARSIVKATIDLPVHQQLLKSQNGYLYQQLASKQFIGKSLQKDGITVFTSLISLMNKTQKNSQKIKAFSF